MTLVEVLTEAGADLDGLDATDTGAGRVWSVGEVPVAAASTERAEFRLAPSVARAALGTADTAPSTRGRDWIAFMPPELDRFAIDRARAWLGSAWRNARQPRR